MTAPTSFRISRPPCTCSECRVYKVDKLEQRYTPDDGWIHGRKLRLWHDARERAMAQARALLGPKTAARLFEEGEF